MTRRRKITLALAAFILLGVTSAIWLTRVPEPTHNGVKLGYFLTNKVDEHTLKTLTGLGPRAVPYLVHEMKPNASYELLFQLAPKLPISLQQRIPNRAAYRHRRATAASLLSRLDTDAISALPDALRAVEQRDSVILYDCVNIIGWLAPGTPYEGRAVNALISATEVPENSIFRGAARSAATRWLMRMDTNYLQIIPVLIRRMYEPGAAETTMKALLRFGTNALPALRLAAEKEKHSHIRPAEMTIEKIEQQTRAPHLTNPTTN